MPIAQEKTYWINITASKPHGVLYIGMTSDLAGRTWEHRERVMDGFTTRLGLAGLSISRRTTMPRLRPSASAP